MKKASKFILLSATLLTLSFGSSQLAFAETAQDPAPVIQANKAKDKHKRILFDNTHAQTSGSADWVIDGGFSDYANALANEGYYVTELRKTTPITLADLKNYDVFVIPEASIPYKVSEQQAISDYVSQGGSVFYIADHYNADRNKNRWDASEVFNGFRRGAFSNPAKGMSEDEKNSAAMQGVESRDWLAMTFGVRFRYNALDNIPDFKSEIMTDAFGILNGVKSVALHAGSTLAITNPQIAKGLVYLPSGLTSANKWAHAVDQGVYDGGGIAEGAYVAISKHGKGKAAFIGDSSAVEDATPKYTNEETGMKKGTYDGFKEESDAKLLLNLTDWLSKQENYTSFSEAKIALSEKTKLNDNESPDKTTEPEPEPWSSSKAGYKWWDSSTFAPGSYGSKINPTKQADYYFTLPDKIEKGKAATIELKFSGLKPNETVSGYSVGVYTTKAVGSYSQGAQVGYVDATNSNNFPKQAGYSDTFSVTADADGNASKKLAIRVDEVGQFNIRLRNGKSNLKTFDKYNVVEAALASKPETTTPSKPQTPVNSKPNNQTTTNATSTTSVKSPATEEEFTGVVYVPVINNKPNWKIALLDGQGHYTGQFISTNTSWKVFAKKQINGKTFFRLGTDKQWIPADYTGQKATEIKLNKTAFAPIINHSANWKIALLDGEGHYTGQFIKTNSYWKVLAEKQIAGRKMYRLGTDKQWVPSSYLRF
ncbi:SLAP domain-containing protein [Lactobacillus psittaci]|uniref:Uncharacterized protein n=1 Tax=Lactobacillus psittaci DSM 15354 TaxID=1122152 RepID=A0A0R1S614_9LACO|nr:SLAP domain-containing protein [Lactobacillus psittaci]KRL62948.1 hypothetical protein FC23_GL001132 [Lactobacillus psittaci DSM 15354]